MLLQSMLAAASAIVGSLGFQHGSSTPASDRSRRAFLTQLIMHFISNSKPIGAFALNGSDKAYNRFQVFDEIALLPLFQGAAALNFGKFAVGKYPLLVWEPADEGAKAVKACVPLSLETHLYVIFLLQLPLDSLQTFIYLGLRSSLDQLLLCPRCVLPLILILCNSAYMLARHQSKAELQTISFLLAVLGLS